MFSRLVEKQTAEVQITAMFPVCIELFCEFKALGRFTLRDRGETIAAGRVIKIYKNKKKNRGVEMM